MFHKVQINSLDSTVSPSPLVGVGLSLIIMAVEMLTSRGRRSMYSLWHMTNETRTASLINKTKRKICFLSKASLNRVTSNVNLSAPLFQLIFLNKRNNLNGGKLRDHILNQSVNIRTISPTTHTGKSDERKIGINEGL